MKFHIVHHIVTLYTVVAVCEMEQIKSSLMLMWPERRTLLPDSAMFGWWMV